LSIPGNVKLYSSPFFETSPSGLETQMIDLQAMEKGVRLAILEFQQDLPKLE